jgi:uncharacterized protein YdeI (YjbR/CyaY-like superfamily)
MKPTFFATAEALRRWFRQHHASAIQLEVGFRKKGSDLPSVTYAEAVDEALCYGWIDGVRHTIDATTYTNRFTPRKPTSNWSAKNVKRFGELKRHGRVRAAGQKAFDARTKARTGTYSYEQRHQVRLDPALGRKFRAKKKAWSWFQDQAPSYRTTAVYWVMSAKKPETRERRLEQLIADSGRGQRVPPLRPPPGKK